MSKATKGYLDPEMSESEVRELWQKLSRELLDKYLIPSSLIQVELVPDPPYVSHWQVVCDFYNNLDLDILKAEEIIESLESFKSEERLFGFNVSRISRDTYSFPHNPEDKYLYFQIDLVEN